MSQRFIQVFDVFAYDLAPNVIRDIVDVPKVLSGQYDPSDTRSMSAEDLLSYAAYR